MPAGICWNLVLIPPHEASPGPSHELRTPMLRENHAILRSDQGMDMTSQADTRDDLFVVPAPVPQIQPPTVIHESPHCIVVEESPPPPQRPTPVGPVSPPPSPRRVTYIQHVDGIPYLIRPSVGGSSRGGHTSSGGAPAPVAARPTPSFHPAGGGALVPPWPVGLLAGAVVGHLLPAGVEVPHHNILGAPLARGGRLT